MIYFLTRGNLQLPQTNLLHLRPAGHRPLQEDLEEDFRVAAPPRSAQDTQHFHGFLLSVMPYNYGYPREDVKQ
jgi:hypothetical protein